MDRRQQKTREAIFNAFIELLESKNFRNITVQEIIDRANVGRSTFYAHFETKDDLLKEMCTEIFHHDFSDALEKEISHDFSNTGHDLEEEITHILYHLRDSRKKWKGFLSCDSGEIFMGYFKSYLKEMFLFFMKDIYFEVPQEYVLSMIINSFAETVRWWVTEHSEYTPEQIASFFITTNALIII